MQNKSKINLYNIVLSKKSTQAFGAQKSVVNIKILLFTLLAITSLASIGQSLSTFDSKTSLANSNTNFSIISSTSRSKILK